MEFQRNKCSSALANSEGSFVFLQSAHFSARCSYVTTKERSVSELRFLWKRLPCNSTIQRLYTVVTSLYDCSFFDDFHSSPASCLVLSLLYFQTEFLFEGGGNCGVLVSSVVRGNFASTSAPTPRLPLVSTLGASSPNPQLLLLTFVWQHDVSAPSASASSLSLACYPLRLTPMAPCQLNCSSPPGCKLIEALFFQFLPGSVGNPLCPHS